MNFPIPKEHLELLGLVRLADYLGVDDFLHVAARWLGVSVTAITNSNSVRKVYQLIRGRYRASKDKGMWSHGVCAWCFRPVYLQAVVPCMLKPGNLTTLGAFEVYQRLPTTHLAPQPRVKYEKDVMTEICTEILKLLCRADGLILKTSMRVFSAR